MSRYLRGGLISLILFQKMQTRRLERKFGSNIQEVGLLLQLLEMYLERNSTFMTKGKK